MPSPRLQASSPLAITVARQALAITLVLTLILSVLEAGVRAVMERHTLVVALDGSVRPFIGPLETMLYNLDWEVAGDFAQGLLGNPIVAGIEVVDANGKTFVSRSRPTDTSRLADLLFRPPIRHYVLNWPSSQRERSGPLGTLIIHADASGALDDYGKSLILSVVNGILRNLALAAVLVVLFRRIVGDPLTALAEAITAVDPSNPDAGDLPDPGRHDELGLLHARMVALITAAAAALARARSAQEDLARHQDALEQTIAERSAALREAQEELVQQETLASLGALVAGIAHEVNTPLSLVLAGVSQIGDDLATVQNRLGSGQLKKSELDAFIAKGRRTGDMVIAHAERAAGLIRNFKQIAVDRASGESRQLSLGVYVGEVIESLKPLWKRQPVTVITDLDDDIDIRTDPGAIAHILQNLVANSLFHAFDPGIPGTIRVTVRKIRDEGVITFADDGKGMDADVLKKIYDPFFTTRRGSGGTGLGMNIVYNMVIGRLKGHIRCESTPGKGTRFILSLPLRT